MKPMEPIAKLRSLGRVGLALLVLASSAMVTLGTSSRAASTNMGSGALESRQLLVGIISDSLCGASHNRDGHGDADCTRACVRLGAKYALVSGTSVFILSGHDADLYEFAGRAVIVTAIMTGSNRAVVEAVAPLFTTDRHEIVQGN